jgi:uncharacterized protein YdeI (YjbR/CyaY-like superfamily)
MKPKFFATPAEWRAWLEKYHGQERELLVGFYKKDCVKPSITWPESVDAALCFGWIDGVRRRIDEESYSIRFTPRKTTSIWSVVNTRRVAELTALGLMSPAGVKAFAARQEKRSGIYTFEREDIAFDATQEKLLRANAAAWKFFQAQPPGYRKLATGWVISAKQEVTRQRRLTTLIEDSAQGRRLRQYTLEPKR